MEKYKTGIIYFLVGALSVFVFLTGYFATAYQAQKDDTKSAIESNRIVKIVPSSSQNRVLNFFRYRTKINSTYNSVFWAKGDAEINEDDLFLYIGAKTNKLKDFARKALIKEGYKRYIRTCGNLHGADWSLGYCAEKPYPIEGKS